MGWALSVIQAFRLVGGLPVTRRGPVTRTNGHAVVGSTTSVTLDPVAVTPTRGKDLDALPDGQRANGAITIYATQELRTASAGLMADRVTYAGELWEVQTAQPWDAQAGYWKAIAVKVHTN